jgi:uncharacterized membrane protein YhiD involved in acid resistance
MSEQEQPVSLDQLQTARRRWKVIAIGALSALVLSWIFGFVVLAALIVQASFQQRHAEAARQEAEEARRQAEVERVRAIQAEEEAREQAQAALDQLHVHVAAEPLEGAGDPRPATTP